MKQQAHLSIRPAPLLRPLLYAGIAASLLAAALLFWPQPQTAGVLTLRLPAEQVAPGSIHTCVLQLRDIRDSAPLDLEVELPDGSGFYFVTGSLQLPAEGLASALVHPYAGDNRLYIEGIGPVESLDLRIDVAIPEDFTLVGNSYALTAAATQAGTVIAPDPARSLSTVAVTLPLFTVEKYLLEGQPVAGREAAYQVVVSNPRTGGNYRAGTMLLEFTDLLYDDGATFDPASLWVSSASPHGDPEINGHILRIADIALAPGEALTIEYRAIFPKEMTGSGANEATLRVGYTELTASAHVSGGTFPVVLRYLEGEIKNDRALLRWETAQEENNRGFGIEQSRDGVAFLPIGFVEGAGSSTEARAYAFRSPAMETGRHIFRLRQEDMDGSITYSQRIELYNGLEGTHQWSIYPNPVRERAFINLEVMRRQPVVVTLWDLQGRQVQRIFKGDMEPHLRYQLPIEVAGLAPGGYIVRAEGAGFRDSHKLQVMPR